MSYGKEPRKFWGALAVIVVAIEGAILLARKQVQGTLVTINGFPKEFLDLISAIASGVGSIIEKLDDVINAIKGIVPGGGGVAYPPNADGITSIFVPCPQVQPSSYPLPNIDVPDTMEVQLLTRNPGGVNVGIIYVGGSQADAGTTTRARPLIPGATIGYKVKNANSIWLGATVAGEGVYLTVEQRTT